MIRRLGTAKEGGTGAILRQSGDRHEAVPKMIHFGVTDREKIESVD